MTITTFLLPKAWQDPDQTEIEKAECQDGICLMICPSELSSLFYSLFSFGHGPQLGKTIIGAPEWASLPPQGLKPLPMQGFAYSFSLHTKWLWLDHSVTLAITGVALNEHEAPNGSSSILRASYFHSTWADCSYSSNHLLDLYVYT